MASGFCPSRRIAITRAAWRWAVGTPALVLALGLGPGDALALPLEHQFALIPRRSTTVLTNSYGAPWTRDGFGSSFNKAKTAAGMQESNLHFHDLRGTAATGFYTAKFPQRAIAEIMGREEEHVARIMRRYVGRSAATQAVIRQINEATGRTSFAEPAARPVSDGTRRTVANPL